MIFITGATGFIGRALLRHLNELEQPVRILLRPSKQSPSLPRGIPVDVAVTELNDAEGLRSALIGADTIYHLAGSEHAGLRGNLSETDIQGTQAICQAAVAANVRRIIFVSHLGADRVSAYPLMKAKAIAEEHVRRSGLEYTIIRSGIVFGPGDHFTLGLVHLIRTTPFFFFVPGDGESLIQPIWVEDLATCLSWALQLPDTINQTIEVGGPEFLQFKQVLQLIMDTTGIRRYPVNIHSSYLRFATASIEQSRRKAYSTVYWLDYLAANRTCPLDTLPRVFNLLPSRISQRLDYLQNIRGQKKRK